MTQRCKNIQQMETERELVRRMDDAQLKRNSTNVGIEWKL
jgi:hypothetical protein